MRRLQVLAVLLLTLLVLDECLGSYQKSSKENNKKKNKAKNKYSESASKQHKKKAREAPVETELNEEDLVGEIDVQETYKNNKNSKNKYSKEIKATKYGKKDKLKSLKDDLYVVKEKESKISKKTKERKQKREIVEEEPIDGEGEENALCSQQCQVEEADTEAEVATVPAKKTPRIQRNIVEEEILEGEESDITEDEEETWERPSPRSAKCSLK